MAAAPLDSKGQAVFSELIGKDPDSVPEVLRELAMLSGAVDALSHVGGELIGRLEHVLALPSPEAPSLQRDSFAVDTPAGRYVRNIFDEVQRLHRRLEDARYRLAV